MTIAPKGLKLGDIDKISQIEVGNVYQLMDWDYLRASDEKHVLWVGYNDDDSMYVVVNYGNIDISLFEESNSETINRNMEELIQILQTFGFNFVYKEDNIETLKKDISEKINTLDNIYEIQDYLKDMIDRASNIKAEG